MKQDSAVTEINSKSYSWSARPGGYDDQRWLPAEVSILFKYAHFFVGKRVLEVGAGWGRLAGPINQHAEQFLATDFNEDMVRALRRNHPTVAAEVADARALSEIANGAFDLVLFAYNGIDSIPHDGRSAVISEAFRVLCDDGIFVHSTHNLAHARSASRFPFKRLSIVSPISALRRIYNRFRLKGQQIFGSKYALVNDSSLENGLLNIYVDPKSHLADLEHFGFSITAIIEKDGAILPDHYLPSDQWYYVICKKIVAAEC